MSSANKNQVKLIIWFINVCPVIVAQLAEHSLLKSEVLSSNLVIGKNSYLRYIFLLLIVEMTMIKKKGLFRANKIKIGFLSLWIELRLAP